MDIPETPARKPDLAFLDAYQAAAPAVYAWVSLHLGSGLRSELDPEDVLQEVACRAFARRQTFDPELAPFRAWLFGIARNVLHGSLERLAAGAGKPSQDWLTTGGIFRVPDDATSITGRIARDDTMARFLEDIEAMEEEDRLLVRYRGLEGLPHDEVGKILGLEAKTAAKRWDRLRSRLRDTKAFLA